VAKFHGDRLRDGGEKLAKEIFKKHHEHFIRPPVTTYGRPNKLVFPSPKSQFGHSEQTVNAQMV